MIATRFRRPLAATLLVAATAFAAILPPAHIHLTEHDDDHHSHARAVEHAHWSPHAVSRAALDDDDGRAIYVDRSAIASALDTSFSRPHAAVIALLTLAAPAAFTVVERTTSGNSPRDGPARALSSLRAPPPAL